MADGDSNLMLPGDVSASFDSLGDLDVPVPSSNDPLWAPVGWTWFISLSVDGWPRLDWFAVVPYNAPGGEIGLAELTPIPTANGELYALFSHSHSEYATDAELGAAIAGLDLAGFATTSALTSGLALKADITDLAAYALGSALTSGLASKADASTTTSALALKAPLASPAFTGTPTGISATHVGLGSVDNTTDAGKPVSTLQQTALNLKAPLASPAFTGTPTGITATHVGLGSVNNTADSAKPVSTAQGTAIGLKSDLASPTFTGTPTLPTGTIATTQTAADSSTKLATTAFATAADNLKANLASPTFTGTVAGITATMVGLGSVNNTADTAKPVSTAQQTALDLKANLASPTLTGVPAAPTATPGTNTTQISTTAFVKAADDLINFTALTAYDESQIVKRAMILPTDHGLGGWTFPADSVQAGTILPTAGVSHIVRVKAMGATVNNILLHLTVGGSGLTAGQCFATLHNDAGAILGAGAVTGDQSAVWNTGGMKVMPLSVAQSVTPGNWYKVRFWFTGTTGPTLSRGVNSSSAITNAGLVAPNFRYGTADTGLTNLASAPNNIGTITGGATAWWVGLS